MESTENVVSSSETKEVELESGTENPETSSCVTEVETTEKDSIIEEGIRAETSEISLTMPIWDDARENQESMEVEKRPLEEETKDLEPGNDAQIEDLVEMDTKTEVAELIDSTNEVMDEVAASDVQDLGVEDTEIEAVDRMKTKDEAESKELDQEADSTRELGAEDKETISNNSKNETLDKENKDSLEVVVDLDREVKNEESIAEDSPDVQMQDDAVEDLDSEVEVLRDDIANIRNARDKVQETTKRESDSGCAETKVSTSETEPEMMILDDSDDENIYDLQVLDSWEEGSNVEDEVEEDGDGDDEEGGIEEVNVEEGGIEEVNVEDGGIEEVNVEEGGIEEVKVEEGGNEKVDDKERSKDPEVSIKDSSKIADDEVEEINFLDVSDDSKILDVNETLDPKKEEDLLKFDDVEVASEANIIELTESNDSQATKIVGLERELAELRSLVEKIEKQGGEDSKEALLVMLSKKKLEVVKLNDTIEEIEQDLQKVFQEKISFAEKIEELEKLISDSKNGNDKDIELKEKDVEIFRLKDELQDALDNVTLLENELKSCHTKEDMIIEKQLDYEEKVSMLEIDLEYAREKREQESEIHLAEIKSFQEQLSLAKEQLEKEKKSNAELRSSLKEEMKQRIGELKESMATEMSSLRKEAEKLRATELEALRKLEDNRSKMDVMTKQNRQLKADIKSKAMEVDAYANIAQQLKSHILKLDKDKEELESKIQSSSSSNGDKKPEIDSNEKENNEETEVEKEESGSPEIITIDTDDQDSNGEEKCLQDLEDFHEKVVKEAEKSATKRPFSPVASDETGKKLKLSLSSVGNCSVNEISLSETLNDNACDEENATISEGDVLCKEEQDQTAETDASTVQLGSVIGLDNGHSVEVDCDSLYAELQEVRRILAEKESELASYVSNVNEKTDVHIALETEVARLQSELCGMIDTRDKLLPQLVSLTEELDNERRKVEQLAVQLHQRTVAEESVLSEQQSRLETLQLQLKAIESELSERNVAIKRLQEEVSCLAAEKVVLTDKNQKLENEVAEDKDNVAVYEQERLKLTEVTEKFEKVSEELRNICKERDQLIARVSILEAADAGIQALKVKNEALQAELSVAVDEQERLKRLVSEVTQGAAQAGDLQQIVDNLKIEVEEAQAKRFELIDELTRRQREVEEERDSLKRLVTEQQDVIMEADVERKLSIENAEATNRTVEDLRKNVAEADLNAKQLQQDIERLRLHVVDMEKQLADNERTIQELTTRTQELINNQESKKLTETEKAEKMKQALEETRRELADALNRGLSLNATVEQLNSEVTEKEKLRLKVEALELELADVLQSRSDVGLKMHELKSDTVKQEELSAKLNEVRGAVTEMMAKREEVKSQIDQLEDSFFTKRESAVESSKWLTTNQTLQADIETVQEGLDEIKSSREDLQINLVELERDNARLSERIHILGSELRAHSECELQDEASKTTVATDEIKKELSSLQMDVKRLSASEALLNRSVLQLRDEVTSAKPNCSVISDVLDVSLEGDRDQLSKLTALISEMENKCEEMEKRLGASKASEAATKESLGASEKMVEELKTFLKTANDNNESLQNRLHLALTNGRRMEALLQKIQKSASSNKKSEASDQLHVVQRERDDLLKKLEESENTKKLLKAKVISLALMMKHKQDKLQNTSCQSVDLDHWEQVVNEVTHSNITGSSELADSSDKESSLKLVLTTNRQNENENCGQKRILGGTLSSVGSKKMCTQVKDDSKLATKKALALNTITNSTPHSLVVPAQDSGSQSLADTRKKEECKVQ